MAQVTIKGLDAIRKMKEQTKEAINDELEDYFSQVANYAINRSPIWSGAYVKSFSFKADNTSSRGRRVNGANWQNPEKTGSEQDRETGRQLLLGDVQAAFSNNDPERTKSYTIRNDANHSRFVEVGIEGGANPPGPKPTNGYRIFEQLKQFKKR